MKQEKLHVAGIGRLAIEDIMTEKALPERLGNVRELRQRKTEPTELARQVGREHTELFHPLSEALQLGQAGSKSALTDHSLERYDFGGEKLAHLLNQGLNLTGDAEFHRL
jgi:hypothetical protein